jgi:hypothetical protein
MNKTAFGLLVILFCCPAPAQALVYNVNRSYPNWALTGTVTCPTGNFVIENQSASPFTDVSLVLTFTGYPPHNLFNLSTEGVTGPGKFVINATATTLSFSAFQDNPNTFSSYLYFYGDNRTDHYDTGGPSSFGYYSEGVGNSELGIGYFEYPFYPIVFATAVPEPTSAALVAFAAMIFGMQRSRKD